MQDKNCENFTFFLIFKFILLKIAYNPIKLYIHSESKPGDVSRNKYLIVAKSPEFFFFLGGGRGALTDQKEIYIFQEIVIPKVNVRLLETFQNLIAIQV